jgi:hypothetical protein
MTPVIRIDDSVMDALKSEAVKRGMVFGTPNDVLKAVLRVGAAAVVASPNPSVSSTEVTENPLDKLFGDFVRRFELESGEALKLELSAGGRWVSVPDNFMTMKIQPRARDIAFTVYGHPRDSAPPTKIKIKQDQSSFSRFKVESEGQFDEALSIVLHARHLSRTRKRR